MAKILPIISYPDPILKQKSQIVDKIDDNLRNFMDDMVKTMYFEKGIGLAAVQVGQLKRVLVMDFDYEIDEKTQEIINSKPIFVVNPEIIEASDELAKFDEGCLSFPAVYASVTRPKKVKIRYFDYFGKEKIEEMTEIKAVCIQHEIDHLDGITFVDHLSRVKRQAALKQLQKNSK